MSPQQREVRHCSATSRQGKQCGRWAMRDRNVCDFHGGKTPGAKQRAAKAELARQAAKLVDVMGVEPVANPLTTLSRLAGEALAFKDALAALVGELTSIRYVSAGGQEQIRGEVQLFTQALDRCGQILSTMAKLQIDSRLVAIEEKQAEMVVRAIEAALQAAEVPADRQTEAKRAAIRHLQAAND